MYFFLVLGLFVANVGFLAASSPCCDEQRCEGEVNSDGCETIDGDEAFPEEEN